MDRQRKDNARTGWSSVCGFEGQEYLGFYGKGESQDSDENGAFAGARHEQGQNALSRASPWAKGPSGAGRNPRRQQSHGRWEKIKCQEKIEEFVDDEDEI